MKILNYPLLVQDCRDPALLQFLITVHDEVVVRRIQHAFPEYFADNGEITGRVRLSALKSRYQTLHGEYGGDATEMTLDWFDIRQIFLTSDPKGKNDTTRLLPPDFVIERDEYYNGLVDAPWLARIVIDVKNQEYLVIDAIKDGDHYFLTIVSLNQVSIDKEEAED